MSTVPLGLETLDQFQLDDYMADFEAVRINNKLEKSAMLGYSHTAFFVGHYAVAMPERVGALVLIEPAFFNDPQELRERARLALEGKHAESLKAMLKLVQPDVAADEALANRATAHIMKSMNNPDALAGELMIRASYPLTEEQLRGISIPILLIGGTKSHANYTIHKMASLQPKAYVWWVEGATHGELMAPQYEEQIARAVDNFLVSIQLE